MEISEKDRLRFQGKFNPSDPDKCWEWSASVFKDRMSYGAFGIGKKIYRAHRISYIIHNGNIPDGLWVLHKCDNPKCVNPHHLFLGNRRINIDDMKNKDRGGHKLKSSDVLSIRSSILDGVELARLYGVTPQMICRIRKRLAWTHL